MPPHIEIDAHNDEILIINDDEPSPLFRDQADTGIPFTSRLDRRQSDPDFKVEGSEMVVKNDAVKHQAVAPVVSRITAIIGPESAYVRTTTPTASNINSQPPATAAAASAAANKAAPPPKPKEAPKPKPPPSQKEGKIESKPILLRATRFVSKKGWKVVKSLPRKVVSSIGGAKKTEKQSHVI